MITTYQWVKQHRAGPPVPTVIWQDGFETDLWTSYFERDNDGGNFVRSQAAAFSGSWSMRHLATLNDSSLASAWVGIGALPAPGFFGFANPVGVNSTNKFQDITVTFRHMASSWTVLTGEGNVKLARINVFANSSAMQAAVLHIWTHADGERLLFDPARGVDLSGNLTVTGWNDTANMTFLGSQSSTTHVYAAANLGHWFLIKIRMKLNTPGLSDGIMELWIDGTREINVTNLNWRATYNTFGINSVNLERFFNTPGAPAANVSYFDDLVITGS